MKNLFKSLAAFQQEENLHKIPDYDDYKISVLGDVYSYKKDKKKLLPVLKQNGYLAVSLCNHTGVKQYCIHYLMAAVFLDFENEANFSKVVDHIDEDKLNNRIDNLQLLTPQENTLKSIKNKSGVAGISWNNQKQKWVARVTINGKRKYLGSFENINDAKLKLKQL